MNFDKEVVACTKYSTCFTFYQVTNGETDNLAIIVPSCIVV